MRDGAAPYCFLLPESAVPNFALRHKMQSTWAEKLVSVDETLQKTSWEEFFLNEAATAEFLKTTPPEVVLQVCNAGQQWGGAGWDTTRCARQVRALTGLAMVRPAIDEYRSAFLYSLCLVANVNLPSLELREAPAEVAFRLADRWQGKGAAPTGKEEREEEQQEEQVEEPFLWESHVEALPSDLARLLQRATAGERLDVKQLLEVLPTFAGLKVRAEENNYRGDGKSQSDRWLKSLQQKILNLLRIYVAIHTTIAEGGSPELVAASQQLFLYVLNVEDDIVKERKKRSIPNSVQVQENALFKAEDLKNEQMVTKVNRAGWSGFTSFLGKGRWYFPKPPGNRSWKFKGGRTSFKGGYFSGKGSSSSIKGKGKGRGAWTFRCDFHLIGHGVRSIYGRKPVAWQAKPFENGGNFQGGNIFENKNLPKRKTFGGGALVRTSEAEMGLVEKERLSGGIAPHCKGGFPGMGSGTENPMAGERAHFPTSERGNRDFVGIQGSGGSEACPNCRDKVFGALVCHCEGGGAQDQKEAYLGLQGNQSLPRPEKVQVGQPSSNFPLPSKRTVGSKIGLERCLFPSGVKPNFATVREVKGGGPSLGVSSGLLWLKHHASTFHVADGNFREKVAKEGVDGVCLLGRHFAFGSFPKTGGITFGHHGGRFGAIGFKDQCGQKCFATNPKIDAFGVPFGFGRGSPQNLSTKIQLRRQRGPLLWGPPPTDF